MHNLYLVVVNRECFEENCLPSNIVGRQRELKGIECCLYPANKGRKPIHAWIHGGSGSGKTMLARFALRKAEQEHALRGTYINCWQHDTLYKVADALTHRLRILYAEQHDTNFKLDRIERQIGKTPFLIVLDEIDQTFPKDRESILGSLCNLGRIGVICISKGKKTFFSLS